MRTAFSLVLVFLAGACWSQVSPKKKVAIFDFENTAVQAETNNSYLRTNAPDLGKGVSELLISKLVQDGNVSVIERNAVDKVLVEQNLTNSNRIDPATAAKLGRLLGVDAIILGTITHYDYDTKVHGGGVGSMLSSSMKSGLGGSAGGSASPKAKYDIHAKTEISARLLSPDTAEVLAVSQGLGETSKKGVKLDARDMGGRLSVENGVNSPVMNESVEQAIAQLSAQLEQQLAKLPPRTPLIEGLVADVRDSGQLVLNVGEHDGVRTGDHLQVWRAGKEILDPATGKVIARDDILLGEAVVTTVNDNFTIARYSGSEPVKVRDLVKGIPKQH